MQNIDENTLFAPHVRGEIGAFGWHPIDILPSTFEESKQLFVNEHGGRHKFFNVWPYVRQLRAWINKKKKRGGRVVSKNTVGKAFLTFKFDRAAIMQHLPPVST